MMSPVHSYGHGQSPIHGCDHLVVGSLQQTDVVHTTHIAGHEKMCHPLITIWILINKIISNLQYELKDDGDMTKSVQAVKKNK